MSLVVKLMRKHISVPQFLGFFLANLLGMVIVLLGVQFYTDVLPLFSASDGFMKKEYIIVSKKVSSLGTLVGKDVTFSASDIANLKEQPFTVAVGAFTPSLFRVSAGLGMEGVRMSTDLFFESVPNTFVDVDLDEWGFHPTDEIVPIILPRNYLNLYNFGFAQSRNLPQLSEGVMGMVNLDIRISGAGQSTSLKGKIVGFSNRLNTLLVPQEFLEWANSTYAPGQERNPSRLMIEVTNPADERIAQYFTTRGYETEGDKLDAGKTTWFLKLVVGVVLTVGVVICLLSFYIFMLSIYLLLEKNNTKLENLLLLGYSPQKVAFPYHVLTFLLNSMVWLLATGVVVIARTFYLDTLQELLPTAVASGMWNSYIVGFLLFLLVTLLNMVAVHRKIAAIWKHRRVAVAATSV
ncbi:MAG: ABC transporter permease [Phocaeicola sp.]